YDVRLQHALEDVNELLFLCPLRHEPARPVTKIASNLRRPFFQPLDVLALEAGVTLPNQIAERFEPDQVRVRKGREPLFEQLAYRRDELSWSLGREGQLLITDVVGQVRK